MKLDRVFFEDLRTQVQAEEKKYEKKYFMYFLVGTLVWYGVGFLLSRHIEIGELLGLVLILPFAIYFGGKAQFAAKAEDRIFKKIAEENGGVYTEWVNLESESAIMFRQGHGNTVSRGIYFQDESGVKFRFLEYEFETGSGKHRKTYPYHVFGVGGLGVVPHMYLNYRNNQYAISIGQKLSLPTEFEKEFSLSIPEGYHLEALQLFTPDVLAAILDLPIKCDIEFVNGEILFFLENIESVFDSFSNLETQIAGAKKITSLLKPKMQHMRWAPVGDKAFSL